ncbi:MAG TPA: hypothetical protein CFH81_08760 [Sulfurovum sp. UBA12169]|nr:MAG TPA: hypothetical protein CFH81_08760 [Sulfurovum sp. UBA12169]
MSITKTAGKELQRRNIRNEIIRRGENGESFLLYMETVFEFHYKKTYVRTWWDEQLAQALMDVFHGVIDRLVVSMPPRHGKTERVVRMFGSYIQGLRSSLKIQYGTYSGTLSVLTAVDTKDIMESEIYREIFPEVAFNPKLNLKEHWKLTAGGEFLATSVGGSNTGIGADIFFGDDLLKAADADSKARRDEAYNFYNSSVLTRLEGLKAVILIMQRLHEDDPAGRVIKLGGLAEHGGLWHELRYPIINEKREVYKYRNTQVIREPFTPLDPVRYGLDFIEQQKKEMSKVEFKRQYMQDAEVSEAGHFKREDFVYVSDADLPEMYRYILVDPAESEEASADDRGIPVVGKWTDASEIVKTVVLDGKYGKWDVYGTAEQIISLMLKYPDAPVLIEGAGGGLSLVKVLRREMLVYNAKAQAQGKPQVSNGITVFKPDNQSSKNEGIKLMTAPMEHHTLVFYKFMDTAFMEQMEKEFLKFNPERKSNTDNIIDPISKSYILPQCTAKKNLPLKPEQVQRRKKKGKNGGWSKI